MKQPFAGDLPTGDACPAAEVPVRAKLSNYPSPYAERMALRSKRALGDSFGLRNFGVNLTTLAPGAVSSLHHAHAKQDELVYVLSGSPTLQVGYRRTRLPPGMVAGFAAGGEAHHLENETDTDVVFLEVGDRTSADTVAYPADDLEAFLDSSGAWRFRHKNGEPY